MGTGGVEKSAAQKNSPLSINDKTKKKKKVLVRVSTCASCCVFDTTFSQDY